MLNRKNSLQYAEQCGYKVVSKETPRWQFKVHPSNVIDVTLTSAEIEECCNNVMLVKCH